MHGKRNAPAYGILAVLTVIVMAMIGGSASAANDGRAAGEQAFTDKAGVEQGVAPLSASEVRARGLDRYVQMKDYAATAPTISGSGAQVTGVKAAGDVKAQASGCWDHWFRFGVSSGVFELFGQTDVTWCGDGQWVTYASSDCWGSDGGYPTYEFLGCENRPEFGEGWNVYEVWSQWHLCPAWVPVWGSCASDTYPWGEFQYQGDGGLVRLGGTT